jgi:hypothetical protein
MSASSSTSKRALDDDGASAPTLSPASASTTTKRARGDGAASEHVVAAAHAGAGAADSSMSADGGDDDTAGEPVLLLLRTAPSAHAVEHADRASFLDAVRRGSRAAAERRARALSGNVTPHLSLTFPLPSPLPPQAASSLGSSSRAAVALELLDSLSAEAAGVSSRLFGSGASAESSSALAVTLGHFSRALVSDAANATPGAPPPLLFHAAVTSALASSGFVLVDTHTASPAALCAARFSAALASGDAVAADAELRGAGGSALPTAAIVAGLVHAAHMEAAADGQVDEDGDVGSATPVVAVTTAVAPPSPPAPPAPRLFPAANPLLHRQLTGWFDPAGVISSGSARVFSSSSFPSTSSAGGGRSVTGVGFQPLDEKALRSMSVRITQATVAAAAAADAEAEAAGGSGARTGTNRSFEAFFSLGGGPSSSSSSSSGAAAASAALEEPVHFALEDAADLSAADEEEVEGAAASEPRRCAAEGGRALATLLAGHLPLRETPATAFPGGAASPLHWAAEAGSVGAMRAWLSGAGFSASLLTTPASTSSTSSSTSSTPFDVACARSRGAALGPGGVSFRRRAALVAELAAHVPPEARLRDGASALYWAVFSGSAAAVASLLARIPATTTASALLTAPDGTTAFELACSLARHGATEAECEAGGAALARLLAPSLSPASPCKSAVPALLHAVHSGLDDIAVPWAATLSANDPILHVRVHDDGSEPLDFDGADAGGALSGATAFALACAGAVDPGWHAGKGKREAYARIARCLARKVTRPGEWGAGGKSHFSAAVYAGLFDVALPWLQQEGRGDGAGVGSEVLSARFPAPLNPLRVRNPSGRTRTASVAGGLVELAAAAPPTGVVGGNGSSGAASTLPTARTTSAAVGMVTLAGDWKLAALPAAGQSTGGAPPSSSSASASAAAGVGRLSSTSSSVTAGASALLLPFAFGRQPSSASWIPRSSTSSFGSTFTARVPTGGSGSGLLSGGDGLLPLGRGDRAGTSLPSGVFSGLGVGSLMARTMTARMPSRGVYDAKMDDAQEDEDEEEGGMDLAPAGPSTLARQPSRSAISLPTPSSSDDNESLFDVAVAHYRASGAAGKQQREAAYAFLLALAPRISPRLSGRGGVSAFSRAVSEGLWGVATLWMAGAKPTSSAAAASATAPRSSSGGGGGGFSNTLGVGLVHSLSTGSTGGAGGSGTSAVDASLLLASSVDGGPSAFQTLCQLVYPPPLVTIGGRQESSGLLEPDTTASGGGASAAMAINLDDDGFGPSSSSSSSSSFSAGAAVGAKPRAWGGHDIDEDEDHGALSSSSPSTTPPSPRALRLIGKALLSAAAALLSPDSVDGAGNTAFAIAAATGHHELVGRWMPLPTGGRGAGARGDSGSSTDPSAAAATVVTRPNTLGATPFDRACACVAGSGREASFFAVGDPRYSRVLDGGAYIARALAPLLPLGPATPCHGGLPALFWAASARLQDVIAAWLGDPHCTDAVVRARSAEDDGMTAFDVAARGASGGRGALAVGSPGASDEEKEDRESAARFLSAGIARMLAARMLSTTPCMHGRIAFAVAAACGLADVVERWAEEAEVGAAAGAGERGGALRSLLACSADDDGHTPFQVACMRAASREDCEDDLRYEEAAATARVLAARISGPGEGVGTGSSPSSRPALWWAASAGLFDVVARWLLDPACTPEVLRASAPDGTTAFDAACDLAAFAPSPAARLAGASVSHALAVKVGPGFTGRDAVSAVSAAAEAGLDSVTRVLTSDVRFRPTLHLGGRTGSSAGAGMGMGVGGIRAQTSAASLARSMSLAVGNVDPSVRAGAAAAAALLSSLEGTGKGGHGPGVGAGAVAGAVSHAEEEEDSVFFAST